MFFNWFKRKPTPAPAAPVSNSTIESPCNGVCEMDWQNNICKSCYRTPSEIGSWDGMNDEARLSVISSAKERDPAGK